MSAVFFVSTGWGRGGLPFVGRHVLMIIRAVEAAVAAAEAAFQQVSRGEHKATVRKKYIVLTFTQVGWHSLNRFVE